MKLFASDTRTVFVESDSAHTDLGLRSRKKRPGPESGLVESFLQTMPLTVPRGCRVTVFREPRLESGFPDIVIVVWREEVTQNWRSERVSLNPHDLRIMHFLHYSRRASLDELIAYFGERASGSLVRLHGAGMIRPVGSAWTPLALSRSFAATKIIAVEAKMEKWSEVVNQAILNTWFASKSYVLYPHLPSKQQLAHAKHHGIGVCAFDGGRVREVAGVSTRLPKSYASWMLNDWAWRTAQDVMVG